MYVKDVLVQNQVGLHARPATFFIQKANEYKSSIWVEKEERRVNAKSLWACFPSGSWGDQHPHHRRRQRRGRGRERSGRAGGVRIRGIKAGVSRHMMSGLIKAQPPLAAALFPFVHAEQGGAP